MTEKEMDNLVNDCVTETIAKNFDSAKQTLIEDMNTREDGSSGLAQLIIRSIELGARYGALGAISALNKLHVVDVEKNPE